MLRPVTSPPSGPVALGLRRAGRLLIEQASVAVPLGLALVFALRCLAVSGFDSDVAQVVLATSSVADVLQATLFVLCPFTLLAGAVACGLQAGEWRALRPGRGRVDAWLLVAAGTGLGVLGLLGSVGDPSPIPGITPLILVLGAATLPHQNNLDGLLPLDLPTDKRQEIQRQYEASTAEATTRLRVAVLVILLAVGLLLALQPSFLWKPPEALVLTSGERISAYVLEATEDSLVLLEERERSVRRVPKEQVERRDFCRIGAVKPYLAFGQTRRGSASLGQCPGT